jgi:hypothetical protein
MGTRYSIACMDTRVHTSPLISLVPVQSEAYPGEPPFENPGLVL